MMVWENKRFALFLFLFALSSQARAEKISGNIVFPEGYPEMKNAVVYIDALRNNLSIPTVDQEINQKDMQYHPFVTVVTSGTKIIFRNSDPHLHTVKSEGGPLLTMKLPMTPVKHRYERMVKQLGVSEILCDIHSQMRAFLLVVPNNNYAITDDLGAYTLPLDLPPYPFELKVWHEVLPPVTVSVKSAKDLPDLRQIRLTTWDISSR